MAILSKFEKQPADVQDFDISYVEWLAALSDTAPGPSGLVVSAEPGIIVDGSFLTAGVAKIWLSGGTDGVSYKITATVTTASGRVKQSEIIVKVKEY